MSETMPSATPGTTAAAGEREARKAPLPTLDEARFEPVSAAGGGASRLAVFADRRQLLLVAAVPVFTAATLVALGFLPSDPMLASGLAAVVIGFAVFLLFTGRIPDAFAIVRLRGLVSRQDTTSYEGFEEEVGRQLNSRLSLIFATIGGLIGFARYPVAVGGIEPLLGAGPRGLTTWGPLALADVIGETVVGVAAGLAIWRMIIVGIKVNELGRLPLRIQLGHPDGCGGFEPIGNLCLWNALILSVPGIFLGWWIMVGPASQYGTRYLGLHWSLAILVVLLATLAFALPIWGVHRAMSRSAGQLRIEIERNARQIDQLARELLASREVLRPKEWDDKIKELESRRALYQATEKVPTWPINTGIVTKFATSQAVPLLGVTGLSKPIVDMITTLSGLLEGGSGG